MSQSIINNVVKSAALLGVMLACQSSFAGVGIFMNATNNTPETFSVSSCEPGFVCGDDGETVTLSSGETTPAIPPAGVPGCNIPPSLDEIHRTVVPPGNYCPLTVTISSFTEEDDNICMLGFTSNASYVTFYQKDTSEQTKHAVSSNVLGKESHDDLIEDYGFSTKDTIEMWKCH